MINKQLRHKVLSNISTGEPAKKEIREKHEVQFEVIIEAFISEGYVARCKEAAAYVLTDKGQKELDWLENGGINFESREDQKEQQKKDVDRLRFIISFVTLIIFL